MQDDRVADVRDGDAVANGGRTYGQGLAKVERARENLRAGTFLAQRSVACAKSGKSGEGLAGLPAGGGAVKLVAGMVTLPGQVGAHVLASGCNWSGSFRAYLWCQ